MSIGQREMSTTMSVSGDSVRQALRSNGCYNVHFERDPQFMLLSMGMAYVGATISLLGDERLDGHFVFHFAAIMMA